MDYDLLIRNGRVVDGSGLPSYIADVGIENGRSSTPAGSKAAPHARSTLTV